MELKFGVQTQRYRGGGVRLVCPHPPRALKALSLWQIDTNQDKSEKYPLFPNYFLGTLVLEWAAKSKKLRETTKDVNSMGNIVHKFSGIETEFAVRRDVSIWLNYAST